MRAALATAPPAAPKASGSASHSDCHSPADLSCVPSSATTNAQGRTDAPLISRDRLERGVYELTFHVGDYFRRNGIMLSDPPFLDRVVIRVGVADPAGQYHIPLLVSPYGYTTYRGS